MSCYAQRVSRLARVFGCPVHEEALVCQTCQPSEPLPPPVAQGMHDLFNRLVARVPREMLAAAARRVGKPPVQEPCGRCGARQTCLSCQVRFGRAMLAAVELTADERDLLDAMLAECRRLDRERRGYDE